MKLRPWKDFQLPAFTPSALVTRRSFLALVASLSRLGGMMVGGCAVARETQEGVAFLGLSGSGVLDHPFRVTGGTNGVSVSPGCVIWPGSPQPVFPSMGGLSLIAPSPPVLAGSGLLCVRFKLSQEVDSRHYSSWTPPLDYGDFSGNTLFTGEPEIVFSSAPVAADVDLLNLTSTEGTYLVPIAHVSSAGIVQYIFQSFAIYLYGLGLQIRFL